MEDILSKVFFSTFTILILIGVCLFGINSYAKYECKYLAMSAFNDDGTKNIDYEVEKVGPLLYKCKGTAKCLNVPYKSVSYTTGIDIYDVISDIESDELFD